MRISDWSSDVCSSDLWTARPHRHGNADRDGSGNSQQQQQLPHSGNLGDSGRAGKACGKPCGGVVSHDSRYLHQPNRYAAPWELGTTEATTHKQARMSAKEPKGEKKAKPIGRAECRERERQTS